MISQFLFKNIDTDDEIRSTANLALNRILEYAPYDSTAVAVLEKVESGYRCSLDIYTRQGPFMTNVFRATCVEAIQAIEEKTMAQIKWWWTQRKAKIFSADKYFLTPVS